jgi:hypothetical protein
MVVINITKQHIKIRVKLHGHDRMFICNAVSGPKRLKKPLDEPTNNGSEVMMNARPSPKEGEGIMGQR